MEAKQPKDVVFFQLFMASQKKLYAFILASVHNYADANDILQETAIVMWRKFDEFDQESNFVAWGIGIARNLIKSYFTGRKGSHLLFDADLTAAIEDKTLERLGREDARMDALKRCCEKLSEFNRYLIRLRYTEGKTIKSIAHQLGKPVQGMYKTLARLQDALLRCIERSMERGAL
jgi:RNA polymerase sigma-70 factor (ECF subfamily)